MNRLVLLWTGYGILFLVGFVYWILSATERIYERISIAQLVFLTYLASTVSLLGWATRDPLLTGLLGIGPGLLLAWLWLRREPAAVALLRDSFQRQARVHRQALAADGEDVAALHSLGDIYRRIGSPEAARKYCLRALELCSGKPGWSRLRSLIEDSLHRIEVDGPATADRADLPALLRVCPRCECIAFRRRYRCPECAAWLARPILAWHAERFNGLFERMNLGRIAVFGLAFLPFLYRGGILAYGVLWGLWTLAFAAARGGPAPAPRGASGEALLFAGRVLLAAALLAGLARYAPGPGLLPAVKLGPRREAPPVAVVSQRDEPPLPGGGGPREAVARYVRLLGSKSREDRRLAARGLCDPGLAIEGRSAVAALREELYDTDEEARDLARRALRSIQGRELDRVASRR